MKSDLLCQEASASSPAAPWGKAAQGKAHSWGSCHPWPCTGALQGAGAAGHRGSVVSTEQLLQGSVALARRGAAHAEQNKPCCISRHKTCRNFFSSFASSPWLSSEPSRTRQAPCPAPAPVRVLLDPHEQLPCRAHGNHGPDKQQTICAGDNNRCHLG